MQSKIQSQQYLDSSIQIKKLIKTISKQPRDNKKVEELIYAAINYAENILGYTICSQQQQIQFSKNHASHIEINIKNYKEYKIIDKTITKKDYIIKNGKLIVSKNIEELNLKVLITCSHIDIFLLQILKLHVNLLYEPMLNKHTSMEYINNLYKTYAKV